MYGDIAQNRAGKRNSVNAKARRNGKFIVNIFHTRRIFCERKRERDVLFQYFFLSRSMSQRGGTVLRVRKYRRTGGWNLRSYTWHARTKVPMPTKCRFAFEVDLRRYEILSIITRFVISLFQNLDWSWILTVEISLCHPFAVRAVARKMLA